MKKEYITRRKNSALLGLCTISGIGVFSLILTFISSIAYEIERFPFKDLLVFCLIFFVLPSIIFAAIYFYYLIKERGYNTHTDEIQEKPNEK